MINTVSSQRRQTDLKLIWAIYNNFFKIIKQGDNATKASKVTESEGV